MFIHDCWSCDLQHKLCSNVSVVSALSLVNIWLCRYASIYVLLKVCALSVEAFYDDNWCRGARDVY